MAKYDQGVGCACGLRAICNCISNSQIDGTKARPDFVPDCFGRDLIEYWKLEKDYPK